MNDVSKCALTEPGLAGLELLQAVVDAGEGNEERGRPLCPCDQYSHRTCRLHTTTEAIQLTTVICEV